MKTPLARNSLLVALALSVLTMASTSIAKLAAAEQPTVRDLTYVVTDSRSLCLDLYQPSRPNGVSPLIIWVHGGAWRSGSKSDVPILGLLEHGFAIASVEYRLSPKAPFPAQVHDIQAAIHVLRRGQRNTASTRKGFTSPVRPLAGIWRRWSVCQPGYAAWKDIRRLLLESRRPSRVSSRFTERRICRASWANRRRMG